MNEPLVLLKPVLKNKKPIEFMIVTQLIMSLKNACLSIQQTQYHMNT